MKIVDSELVKSVDWSDDQVLSGLCTDEDYFIVVNPELEDSILKLIDIDIQLNINCVKYNMIHSTFIK